MELLHKGAYIMEKLSNYYSEGTILIMKIPFCHFIELYSYSVLFTNTFSKIIIWCYFLCYDIKCSQPAIGNIADYTNVLEVLH